MTQIVHVANTDVEFEFAASYRQSLELSWSYHPLCLQLQFLPLLYADPEDIVAVTHLPDDSYLTYLEQQRGLKQRAQLVLLQQEEPFKEKICCSWGPSQQVQAWAKQRQMTYLAPDWEMTKLINSKAFSFNYTALPDAALIENEANLRNWMQKVQGPKVLKTCFGLSGRGNWQINDLFPSPKLLVFCQREWQQKRPIIAEPWVDRLHDFSTQWRIHPDKYITYIGATRFNTDNQGTYQGTLAGPEKQLFSSFEAFLHQHQQVALQALRDIAAKGFFGYVGIDALLYRHPHTQHLCLYPLVEINGRQTMSLLALRLQQQTCPNQILHLNFQRGKKSSFSLLPHQIITSQGRLLYFRHQLFATCLPNFNDS